MKVSVILPSLNVRQYIPECIESVINQTLKEIEIICVDAGSTDGTLEVLREYEKKDGRIKVIVSDKKSYGYQMNLGLSVATGEYIGIVETDDYVVPEMYEELYQIAIDNEVDFVKADFYRFTGKGDNLSKAYYKLAQYKFYYNKIIDIVHNQETFGFVMNTWSGIYKRQFLLENDIKHNETPGASFQDNGFWFQTFIYAKKAYFVNKAYYMNRRDNEGSSVYSKNKVYCICDEYDYIFDILKKNKKLYENFGFIFVYACFRAYKSNLNRIADEYKKEFLCRWANDFRKYRDLGLLDLKKMDGTDWNILLQIIDNPMKYYEESFLREQLFFERAKAQEQIIIYGAGMIGRRILEKLTYCENPANVISFAVTKKEENYSSYKNVPIREIGELLHFNKTVCVIIGTTEIYQKEIRDNLERLGFENILAAPYGIDKDENYYKKLTYENRKEEIKKWYELTTGHKIDINNPSNFNEKMQWHKLNDISEEKLFLADRLNQRQHVKKLFGESYLLKLWGVYENCSEVDYEKLPNEFIVYSRHKNSRHFIEDKSDTERFNWEIFSRRFNQALKNNHAYTESMELWYKDAKPGLMIEIPPEDLIMGKKFKVCCIHGKLQWIISELNGRGNWDAKKRDFFDGAWNHLEIKLKYPNALKKETKPVFLDEMISCSEKIAAGIDFLVVCWYATENGFKFDNLQFTLGSGVEYGGNKVILI